MIQTVWRQKPIKFHMRKGAGVERGFVTTEYGVVMYNLHRQGLRTYCTELFLMHKGRLYCRRFIREYSDRYLLTVSNRFARDIETGQRLKNEPTPKPF